MRTITDVYGLARCVLWVEDDLTRQVLTDFWEDKDIRVMSAAGRDGVVHLVNAAPQRLKGTRVVGLVDRDLSPSYPTEWDATGADVLSTPTHEFENLLLDFDVLSAIAGQDATPDGMEAVAREFAESIRWWMVCKRVCHELSRDAFVQFPGDPPVPSAGAPMEREGALSYLQESKYWKEQRDMLRRWDNAYIEQRIDSWATTYSEDLGTGEWVRSFSGKEIFRYVRSEVKSLAKLAKAATPAQNDEDLGKRIARLLKKRRFEKTSPTAKLLSDLRALLRVRAGLQP